MNFSEWQRVIRSKFKLIFLRDIKAMCPVAHESKSPVDKAAKVGVQVLAKAKFFLPTRSNLQMTTGILQLK